MILLKIAFAVALVISICYVATLVASLVTPKYGKVFQVFSWLAAFCIQLLALIALGNIYPPLMDLLKLVFSR